MWRLLSCRVRVIYKSDLSRRDSARSCKTAHVGNLRCLLLCEYERDLAIIPCKERDRRSTAKAIVPGPAAAAADGY